MLQRFDNVAHHLSQSSQNCNEAIRQFGQKISTIEQRIENLSY